MQRAVIVVDNRLRLRPESPEDRIGADEEQRLREPFQHKNPRYWKRVRGSGAKKKRPFGIPRTVDTSRREDDGSLSFPRGGMARLRAALTELGVSWRTVDERVEGTARTELTHRLPPGTQLYRHQLEAIARMLKGENTLLRAPTSAGKSTIGVALAARIGLATLVLVDTMGLVGQWRERARDELGLDDETIGQIGDGVCELRPFTVGLPASVLAKLRDPKWGPAIRGYFGAVVGDEIQIAASDTMYEVVDQLPARHRHGISADERRGDEMEFLTRDLFGDEPVYEIDREDLVSLGIVCDVEILVVPTGFEAPWYVASSGDLAFGRLLEQMVSDRRRTEIALDLAKAEADRGERVLIFSHRVEHCYEMGRYFVEQRVPSGYLLGGKKNRVEFDLSLAALRSGEKRVGIGTYKSIGKGTDLPYVTVGVATTPIAGNPMFLNQVRGRIARKPRGKTRASLYVLYDFAVFGTDHLRKLARNNPTVRVRTPRGWEDARDALARARMGRSPFD